MAKRSVRMSWTRLLAEEVVDPVDLILAQDLQDMRVQRLRRCEVAAERLLDDDAAPGVLVLRRHPGSPQPVDHRGEEPGGDGEVKEAVVRPPAVRVDAVELRVQGIEGGGIGEVPLEVAHAVQQPAPLRLVDAPGVELAAAARDEALHRPVEPVAPALVGVVGQIDADEPESLRQAPRVHEVVERRHHQPPGEVPGGAEDHHGAGRRLGRVVGRLVAQGQRRMGGVGHGLTAPASRCPRAASADPPARPSPDGRRTGGASPTAAGRRSRIRRAS